MAKRKVVGTEKQLPRRSPEMMKKAIDRKEDSELVERINSLSLEEFRDRYVDGQSTLTFHATKPDTQVKIDFKASADLQHEELEACFHLIHDSSKADYEASSWGWHPKRKKKEMREPEMRYLVVRRERSGGGVADALEGFLSFMITHDSTPSVPALYIYEIHLAESLRGTGLGSFLMRHAEDIASRVRVDKVMLTCFLSNDKARSFYTHLGYQADACSPEDRKTRNKVIKVDYEIMSKAVWENEA